MSSIYNKYFAKDKPLRHYSQHLLVALIGFATLSFLNINLNLRSFLVFIIATYSVDLDGFMSVFIFRQKIKEAGEIVKALATFNFLEASTLATMHHKKLNRLIFHNVISFLILLVVLVLSIYTKEEAIIIIAWAIFFHFVFDITDDLYQLGHIKNWLWPINYLSKHDQ